MTRFVFVTGGVVSSLGKGIATASLGAILEARGLKVAMVKLVEHLRSRGFQVFDAQMMNPHLERFGAYVVDSRGYDRLLQRGIRQRCRFC